MFKPKFLRLKTTAELFEHGKELGVFPKRSRLNMSGEGVDQIVINREDVLARVMDGERAKREWRLSIAVMIATIASAISAAASLWSAAK